MEQFHLCRDLIRFTLHLIPLFCKLNFFLCSKLSTLKDKPRQGEDFKESLARMKENPRTNSEHELSKFKVSNSSNFP